MVAKCGAFRCRGSCRSTPDPLGFLLRRARSATRTKPRRAALGGSQRSVGEGRRTRNRFGELKGPRKGPFTMSQDDFPSLQAPAADDQRLQEGRGQEQRRLGNAPAGADCRPGGGREGHLGRRRAGRAVCAGSWKTYGLLAWATSPGCYSIKVDGRTFSHTIVFRVAFLTTA